MKKTIYLIICIIMTFSLVSCNSGNNISVNSEYELTEITLQGKNGAFADDYKLAFMPATQMEEVKAFMIVYSIATREDVEIALEGLNYEQLKALDDEESKAYFITDLSYADGVGNTLDMNQKDIVTGKSFGAAGEYRFYAATISNDGLLALAEADRTEIIEGFASNVEASIEGNSVKGTYECDNDKIDTLAFYSPSIFAVMEKNCSRIKYETVKSGKTVVVGQDESFNFDLLKTMDFDNKPYNEKKVNYVYVASYKDGEFLGLSYDDANLILPKDYPKSSGKIAEGNGVVFPNGGASLISGDRSSIVSKNQSLFKDINETPRIAVIGASSGNEATISSYFYLDDSTDSYIKRFEEAGFEAVYIPLTIENKDVIGESQYFAKLIESSHGVYFTGGDQEAAMISMTNQESELNAIGKAIVSLHERGGILMGSSAGAHILGNICHQDSDSVAAITGEKASVIYSGLPCAKQSVGSDIIFESHSNARGRLGRLIKAMLDKNVIFGAGLDEGTGIAIKSNIGTVYGTGQVFLVDLSETVYNANEDFKAENIIVHILSQGDKYDFNKKEVIFAAKNTGVTIEPVAKEVTDFFGENYMTTLAFMDLLSSEENSKAFTSGDIEVVLKKSDDTVIKVSEKETYSRINQLSEIAKFAASNINLSIRTK